MSNFQGPCLSVAIPQSQKCPEEISFLRNIRERSQQGVDQTPGWGVKERGSSTTGLFLGRLRAAKRPIRSWKLHLPSSLSIVCSLPGHLGWPPPLALCLPSPYLLQMQGLGVKRLEITSVPSNLTPLYAHLIKWEGALRFCISNKFQVMKRLLVCGPYSE